MTDPAPIIEEKQEENKIPVVPIVPAVTPKVHEHDLTTRCNFILRRGKNKGNYCDRRKSPNSEKWCNTHAVFVRMAEIKAEIDRPHRKQVNEVKSKPPVSVPSKGKKKPIIEESEGEEDDGEKSEEEEEDDRLGDEEEEIELVSESEEAEEEEEESDEDNEIILPPAPEEEEESEEEEEEEEPKPKRKAAVRPSKQPKQPRAPREPKPPKSPKERKLTKKEEKAIRMQEKGQQLASRGRNPLYGGGAQLYDPYQSNWSSQPIWGSPPIQPSTEFSRAVKNLRYVE